MKMKILKLATCTNVECLCRKKGSFSYREKQQMCENMIKYSQYLVAKHFFFQMEMLLSSKITKAKFLLGGNIFESIMSYSDDIFKYV